MSHSEYQIRRPRMTDADALGRAHVQIWREAYRGLMTHEALAALDPGTRADRWRTIIETTPPQRRTFVAEHRGTAEVVGFITVDESRDEDPPTPLELWALNVVSAHHGTGVAQALVDRALGRRAAHLWVIDGNHRAQAFYRRNGFRDDGGRKRDDDLGVDLIRMSRM